MKPLEALERLYDYHNLHNRNVVAYLLEQENLPTYYKIIETTLKDYEKIRLTYDMFREDRKYLAELLTIIDEYALKLLPLSLDNQGHRLTADKFLIKVFKQCEKNEKKLKALEIIKEKNVDVWSFKKSLEIGSYYYKWVKDDECFEGQRELTEEEFDLLKEELL